MKNKSFKLILLFLIFFLGAISLLITYFDTSFKYQKLCLILYFISILPIIFIYIFKLLKDFLKNKYFSKSINQFLVITILAVITRFIFLSNYPFTAFGDEVRDGGLNGVQIYNHEISNIFGYGRYDAHGLIIPTITSFFYQIFGNSVLMYRIPAAIISILDIFLIYIFIFNTISPKAGFYSALSLISLPLHIFYGRTQIVVIFSSFITTFLIISLYFYFSQKKYWRLIFLGILIGLSFNFHASVKTVGLTILLIIFLLELRKISWKSVENIFIICISVLIGFGPRLVFTSLNIYFHSSRLGPTNNLISTLPGKYFESLLVWFIYPTQSFFKNNLPLLPIPLLLIIILGLFFYFKNKKNVKWFNCVLFLAISIPFTNSAITDGINFDHRLSPLFSISAILVGCCVFFIFQNIHSKILKMFSILLIFFFCFQIINFFTKRLADVNWNNNVDKKDFLSMHLIKFIQSNKNLPFNLCISVPNQFLPYFNLVHIQEQYQFFLPKYSIVFSGNDVISDNESVINPNCQYQKEYKKYNYSCSSLFDFSCPKKYFDNFSIYY